VLKDDSNTKASAYCGGLILKNKLIWKLQCYGVPHTNQLKNKLTSLRKRKIYSSKEHSPKMMRGYLTVQTIDRRLKNSSLISEMY
jgi:hypothetical protein